MQDDENTQDLDLEQQEEETDVEETESTTEEDQSDDTEDQPKEEKVTLSPAELRHFRKWQKAQKSEPETKEPTVQKSQTASSQPNVEETVLLAQGVPEELLTQLKKVATINGTSLLKAQNDPIYVAIKEKFEKDQRRSEASLGSTRGASTVKAKKDFATPALSREEHMKMVKETL